MCGRLNMASDPADFGRELGVEYENYSFTPRYNVPPGSALPFICDSVNADGVVQRRLETGGWGLVPAWAKETKIGFRAFNARSETVADKPMFRSAFIKRRCVIPVNGYYEWKTEGAAKTPWFMHAASGDWLIMAGLFEFAKVSQLSDPPSESDPRVTDGWYVSTTILTTSATGHLADVHDRMPVMIPRDHVGQWLAPHESKAEVGAVLDGLVASCDPTLVDRYQVGKAVGNVRNDDPSLAQPVEV